MNLGLLFRLAPALAALHTAAPAANPPPDAPAPPAAPAPAPPDAPKPSSSMPAETAGFAGSVSGIVETINDRTSAFKIKITKAVPAPSSTAPQPDALVALVVEIGARGTRDASGKWTPDPAHIAWIASLKPGKGVTLDVSFSSKMNRLRIEKLPAAP
jgi:hypothetical protein